MEEKIILTEEQAENFVKEFCNGDIFGFEYLYKILKEELQIRDTQNNYSIYDLLKDTIAMNNMYVWGCEDTDGLGEFYNEIENLYSNLKTKLFNSIENDLDKYWKKYW